MDAFSIRVKQLRTFKFYTLLILSLIILFFIGFEIGFYYLYQYLKNYDFLSFLYQNESLFLAFFFLIINVFLFILLLIVFLFRYNKYQKNYVEYLFNECRLDELYMMDYKLSKNNKQYNEINKYFNIHNISIMKSYSFASSKHFLIMSNIYYIKNKKWNQGILFSLDYDVDLNGFLLLSHNDYLINEDIEDNRVFKFSFSNKSVLRHFKVYSSFGSEVYKLEDNKVGASIVKLEKYFNRNIDFAFHNGKLYILVSDYKLKLHDNLFKIISSSRFQDKIDSLESLYRLFFALIDDFEQIFINN